MIATAKSLDEILAPARHVLLDFDGPVCSVFDGFPAGEVAVALLRQLPSVREGWAAEHDPLALLRKVGDAEPASIGEVDARLADLESEAVRLAKPTAGATDFLRACEATGRRVWVVSNNATAAIEQYFADHGLEKYVSGCFGRVPGQPDSMKPSPQLLTAAMRAADAEAAECIFIGDAVRDVEAAHAADMEAIGYANKPGKADRLAAAGAVAVVTEMAALAAAMPPTGHH